ncbi:hypothetical protein E6R60_20330 [Streptomyces sp. A0642]|uniref:hypothetical protein n=1 Tax=Streptomyces sp. A0642 TaxID=2563100 RepID=UPI0010A2489E|nr:hypothetical protein [Streptomyces sp. A0642]THA74481.1 hypothetical protein E6R60_20330 [Streptomyces sp. A0642]
MTWTYCEQWNELSEQPMNPLSIDEARSRHAAGELYTALPPFHGKPSPALRVEIRRETGYAAVIFMDAYGRNELDYTFSVIDDSLFLEQMFSYDYGGSEERGGYADAESVESFTFAPDGVVWRTVESGAEATREGRQGVDVACNWEPFPEFGEYESLTRWDRG